MISRRSFSLVFAAFLTLAVVVVGVACILPPEAQPAEPPVFEPLVATEPLAHKRCAENVCGDVPAGPVPGVPDLGRAVFIANGCSGCHHVDSEEKLVGPGLLGIGERAEQRVSGLSAEQYIRESLRDPSAFIVETYPAPSTMPTFDTAALTEQDMRNVLAYLDTLEP